MQLGTTGSEPGEPDDFARLRSNARAARNLTPLVAGQAVSMFGDYVAVFTLPYFVLSLTGKALDLGLTAAFETLPMLLFGFIAGVFLDRRRRLVPVLAAADLLRASIFVLLALAAIADAGTPTLVFGLAFATGSLSVVFDSGLQAAMPGLLEDHMLVDANSKLALARTTVFALGPLVAGFAISATNGFAIAFTLNAATFVVSALFLSTTRVVRHRETRRRESFLRSIAEGIRFLLADRRLRWATLGGAVTNLVFAPLEALLIFFVATEILATDVSGFALTGDGLRLGVYFSLQALIGALGVTFAPRLTKRMSLGRLYVLGLTFFGAGFFVVALWHSYWSVLFAGAGVAGITWVNVGLSTLRQRLTPPHLLGRVISASRTIAYTGLPVGAAVGGFVADRIGVVPVYVFGSAMVLVVSGVLVNTELFRADRLDD